MRSMFIAAASLSALMACTSSSQPPLAHPSPEVTSPSTATPGHQTFVLHTGQDRLNLKPSIVSPGDIVVCDGMTVQVPRKGHRGASGKIWVATSTTGSVSMGCHTPVAWGTTTNLY
jgi:hypothetical protein